MSTSAWDLAGGLVPEILGSPGGVLEVADSWRQAGGRVGGAAGLVGQAGAGTPSWQGEAASAFQESTGGLETDLGSLQTTYQGGAGVLESYAGVLRAAQDAAATLRAEASSLLLDALGDPVKALAAMAALTTIAKAAATIQTEVTHAASTAAAALSTSGISSASPVGNSSAKKYLSTHTKPLTNDDIERIKRELTGNAGWRHPEQGEIGDCYLLAVLEAYARTDEGRKMLRDNVRWDESKKAFIVTFYKDGEKKEIEIRHYYDSGNRGWPGLINIYEYAYAQLVGESDFPNGYTGKALESISGKSVRYITTKGGGSSWPWEEDHQYTDDQWEEIKQAIKDGKPVVGNTYGGDFGDHEDAVVEATTDTNDDGKVNDKDKVDTNQDGVVDDKDTQPKYKIAGGVNNKGKTEGHAYTIVAIDDKYVTLRNPWGSNGKVDSDKQLPGVDEDVYDGLIRISREDYEKYFSRTYIGEY